MIPFISLLKISCERTPVYVSHCSLKPDNLLCPLSPLLPRERTMNDVKFMGEAAMSIIRGKTRKIDVLKIEADTKEQSNEQSNEQTMEQDAATERSSDERSEADSGENTTTTNSASRKKIIYALAGLEWGMFREVEEITDKYWYWGKRLKSRLAYLFSVVTLKVEFHIKAESDFKIV